MLWGVFFIEALNDEMILKVLNLPFGVRPLAVVPLGYPSEAPQPPVSMKLNDLIHLNSY
jgi:nitroreductase